jgi:hypothetical protein
VNIDGAKPVTKTISILNTKIVPIHFSLGKGMNIWILLYISAKYKVYHFTLNFSRIFKGSELN